LNGLDAVDRGGLAFVECARNFLAAQFDHCRGQIAAQRRQMCAGASGDAAGDAAAVDDDHPPALERQLIGHRDAGDAGARDNDVAGLVAVKRTGIRRNLDIHP
jgi:hypothetical protein